MPTPTIVGSPVTINSGTGVAQVTGSVTAGTTLVGKFTGESSSGSYTVSDNQNAGNYNPDFLSQVAGRGTSLGTASKVNGFTGTITITLTVGVNTTGKFEVLEYPAGTTFDSATPAEGDGTAGPTVTNTPTAANCSAIGLFTSGAAPPSTTDAGYSVGWAPEGLNLKYHASEYIADAGTGAETITFGITPGSNGTWHMGLAMYAGPAASPTITSTSSASPRRGTNLTITGSGFGASQGTQSVKIGGVTQTVASWSASSITITNLDTGANKYGVSGINVEIWNSGSLTSNSYALTSLQPPVGWSFVDIVSPNLTASLRITATPDLATGDQVEYSSSITAFADGTFSAPGTLPSFQFRVLSVSGGGWGNLVTQVLIDLKGSKGQFDKCMSLKGWF